MSRSTHRIALAALVLAAPGFAGEAVTQSASRAPGNPACALLSDQEVHAAAGRDYGRGSPGDELGEGVGGGASCQWGGPSFGPGEDLPFVNLVFIPKSPHGSYTERSLTAKPMQGCTRETLRGVGDLAFLESCEGRRGPVAYVKAGRNDVVVQAEADRGKPAASAKPVTIAVAKAAAAKARTK